MAALNFILNLIGLTLWLNWLDLRSDSPAWSPSVSLAGTLRRADFSSNKRWKSLGGLVFLLLARALIYCQVSSQTHWVPLLNLGLIDLHFHLDHALRFDFIARGILFSLLSFLLTLLTFYLWLLLLSVVNTKVKDTDPYQKMVRTNLRLLERNPDVIKMVLPFFVGAFLWFALHPLLSGVSVLPAIRSAPQFVWQLAVIGAATYLLWKYLIVGILLLHLLNSYVYLGNHAFWNFINTTARNLLWPVRWIPLRFGKVDFLPLAAMALVFFLTELVTNPPNWPHGLRPWFYHMLPF